MKTTYKLLGSFWDGRKDLETPLAEYSEERQIRDYKEESDLFDTLEYIRSVRISELFRLEYGNRIFSVLDKLRLCSKVIIILDCYIKSENPVIRNFLSKRISQCLRLVQDYLAKKPVEIYIQSEKGQTGKEGY